MARKRKNPPRNVQEAAATFDGCFCHLLHQKKDVWLMIGFVFLYRLLRLLNAITPLFLKDSVTNGGLCVNQPRHRRGVAAPTV